MTISTAPAASTDHAATRRALAQALDSHGPAADMFAAELQRALPWMSADKARQSASDILARRRAEQLSPAQTPALPDVDGLPPGKLQELVESLAQPREGTAPGSADALIHIYANLRAQYDLHVALADSVFRAGGPFEESLGKQLSALHVTDAGTTAADFVRVRRDRAAGVAHALRPDGPAEQQAIALASRLRRAGDATTPRGKPTSRLAQDIAFGIEQTFACWVTDFIDPFVGTQVQKKFEDAHHHGTLKHNLYGEAIGDTGAFFAFLGVSSFFPQAIDAIKQLTRKLGDGFYNWSGKKQLSGWAKSHDVAPGSDIYRKKLEEWKDFQADTFAKSSVITVSSVGLNVAAQKALGNTHSYAAITGGKLIGAALTMGAMLGTRFLLPKATHELDEELSNSYFTPIIQQTQKLFGAQPAAAKTEREPVGRHTARLAAAAPVAATTALN